MYAGGCGWSAWETLGAAAGWGELDATGSNTLDDFGAGCPGFNNFGECEPDATFICPSLPPLLIIATFVVAGSCRRAL